MYTIPFLVLFIIFKQNKPHTANNRRTAAYILRRLFGWRAPIFVPLFVAMHFDRAWFTPLQRFARAALVCMLRCWLFVWCAPWRTYGLQIIIVILPAILHIIPYSARTRAHTHTHAYTRHIASYHQFKFGDALTCLTSKPCQFVQTFARCSAPYEIFCDAICYFVFCCLARICEHEPTQHTIISYTGNVHTFCMCVCVSYQKDGYERGTMRGRTCCDQPGIFRKHWIWWSWCWKLAYRITDAGKKTLHKTVFHGNTGKLTGNAVQRVSWARTSKKRCRFVPRTGKLFMEIRINHIPTEPSIYFGYLRWCSAFGFFSPNFPSISDVKIGCVKA